jgi:hypothetical protein
MAAYSTAAAAQTVVAKAVHVGSNTVVGTYSSSTALSAGDVISMCKIPKGGRLVSLMIQGNVVGTSGGFGIGDAGSATRHGTISLTATSTTLYPATFQPGFTYLSAGDTANEWLILATVGSVVSNSGGASFNVLAEYVLDGLSPGLPAF